MTTDVCSGWTEVLALLAREQSLIAEGLDVIRQQLPVSVLGIDTDNDSVFINETLVAYCSQHQLLSAHPSVSEAVKERLHTECRGLDPLALLHRVRECPWALAALRSGEVSSGAGRESLEEFCAKLPELWREGEA